MTNAREYIDYVLVSFLNLMTNVGQYLPILCTICITAEQRFSLSRRDATQRKCNTTQNDTKRIFQQPCLSAFPTTPLSQQPLMSLS